MPSHCHAPPFRRLWRFQGDLPLRGRDGLKLIGWGNEVLAVSRRANIKGTLPFSLNAPYQFRQLCITGGLHYFIQRCWMWQERIPYLKTAQIKIEAPAHGFVNDNDAIRDLLG